MLDLLRRDLLNHYKLKLTTKLCEKNKKRMLKKSIPNMYSVKPKVFKDLTYAYDFDVMNKKNDDLNFDKEISEEPIFIENLESNTSENDKIIIDVEKIDQDSIFSENEIENTNLENDGNTLNAIVTEKIPEVEQNNNIFEVLKKNEKFENIKTFPTYSQSESKDEMNSHDPIILKPDLPTVDRIKETKFETKDSEILNLENLEKHFVDDYAPVFITETNENGM
ncbi:adenylate cyclase, germination specific-like [Octopus sinensis]|uniref:Adenylate cyclase, germination specific-like n=1 Tax=Octopus sinensis TaxID=2607531 RepID=A0A7E6EIE4_9MOLL|nr:adenylate cyclase, germination specific-like [Octopus sinensis]